MTGIGCKFRGRQTGPVVTEINPERPDESRSGKIREDHAHVRPSTDICNPTHGIVGQVAERLRGLIAVRYSQVIRRYALHVVERDCVALSRDAREGEDRS